MPLTNLLDTLRKEFPDITFTSGEHFFWSPSTATITYTPEGDPALLLHEVSHAALQHDTYLRDIELITLERDAWEHAKTLAKKYGIHLDTEKIESHLDTYREWLHARSTCPTCTATGYQSGGQTYTCPACLEVWKVNEARICQLRRTRVPSPPTPLA